MNKISNYMVTQTGSRRTVTFTREKFLGDDPGWITEAVTYSYGPRNPLPQGEDEDGWEYILPDGRSYTHPNKHGCLNMILQDAIGMAEHKRKEKPEPFMSVHNRL